MSDNQIEQGNQNVNQRGRRSRRQNRGGRNQLFSVTGIHGRSTGSTILNTMVISSVPEISRVWIDFVACFNQAFDFDDYVRRLARRGAWQHRGYYAGIYLWALADRLQRVGIATHQIQCNSNEIFQAGHILLPSFMNQMLAQYGMVMDLSANVQLQPYITIPCLIYIATVARNLIVPGHGDQAISSVAANHLGFAQTFYGVGFQADLGLHLTAWNMNVTRFVIDRPNQEEIALSSLLIQYNERTGVAWNINTSVILVANTARGFFSQAGAAPAVGGIITAGHNAAIVNARNFIVNAANPFAGSGILAALANSTNFPGDINILLGDLSVLGTHIDLFAPSMTTTGTLSMCVSTGKDDTTNYVSGESYCKDTSPEEYYIGICSNHRVLTVNLGGHIINVSSNQRSDDITLNH